MKIKPANPRIAFFDDIALKWDSWEDLKALSARLDAGLAAMDIRGQEYVADMGCGTGNLTLALLRRLSSAGKVLAVDISARMLEIAKSKITDCRVIWHRGTAEICRGFEGKLDRIICYSVWPHFQDSNAAARHFFGMLKPGGNLHVWHLIPRSQVNEIHRTASEAVKSDLLPPANDVAATLVRAGFGILSQTDDKSGFLVNARKASCTEGRP